MGIIESSGKVLECRKAGGNITFRIESSISSELREDQSVAHNGVCLTVESLDATSGYYQVTAIAETLEKTMLGELRAGSIVNLERAMRTEDRLDGHFVQGHIDTIATVCAIKDMDGSSEISIAYPAECKEWLVPRGSICVNGISLTIARESLPDSEFTVCIIPYTRDHTNIRFWESGTKVNLEFDILGKYAARIFALRQKKGES